MFPIDKSFKPAHCCRIIQWEDVLRFNGHSAQIGVFLEDDDLKEIKKRADIETYTVSALFEMSASKLRNQ